MKGRRLNIIMTTLEIKKTHLVALDDEEADEEKEVEEGIEEPKEDEETSLGDGEENLEY